MKLKPTIAALTATLMTLTTVNAAVYDLKTDWSDASNPNGVWSYLVNDLTPVSSIRGGDPFSAPGAPNIWGSNHIGWSQSIGTENFPLDLQAGDIYGHPEPSSILSIDWTSPFSGIVEATGGLWAPRDIGRSTDWLVRLNGVTIEASGQVFSGDSFSRSNPNTFNFTTFVQPGDILELRVFPSAGQSFGDYIAANFTVTTMTTVPEPSTAFFSLACASLVFLRRTRHGCKG